MVQSLSLKNAFKFGPKHYLNVRNSINFAFNSSRMGAPTTVKSHRAQEALDRLPNVQKQFELLYCLQDEQV